MSRTPCAATAPLVATERTFRLRASINISTPRGFGPVNRINPMRTRLPSTSVLCRA